MRSPRCSHVIASPVSTIFTPTRSNTPCSILTIAAGTVSDFQRARTGPVPAAYVHVPSSRRTTALLSGVVTMFIATLVTSGLFDRLQDIRGLRKDRLLEVGIIGHRHVLGADPADRRVEMFEQVAGDPRGDFRAKAAEHLILVRDDDAVGSFHILRHRFPVVRR